MEIKVFAPSQVDLSTKFQGSSLRRPEIEAMIYTVVKFLQENGDCWKFNGNDYIYVVTCWDRSKERFQVAPADILHSLVFMKLLTDNGTTYMPTFKLLGILEDFKK
jgi:hypothetical protein